MLLPPESTMNRNTSRREPMPDPPPSSRTNEATVRAALETAASVEDRVAQSPGSPTHAGVARGGVDVPSAAQTSSHKPGANSQKPSIHAGGNNRTTTRKVSPDESKSTPLGSPTPTGVVSVGAETATGRPNVPGLVPNPQPIPFPSKAELEKMGFRFGPFSAQHNPVDVEMIDYYAKRGYRPLQPHEVDYAEFRSNGVPFALASKVPHRPQPPTTASPD